MDNIIVVGDMHAPFINKKCVEFILKSIKAFQPKLIIQIGDSVDFYAASRFSKKHFITPEDEFIEGRKFLEEFFAYAHKVSPKSEIHLLKGNHCDRVIKKTMEMTPELEYFMKAGVNKYFTFDNVITHHDSREPFEVDDILFMHGFLSGLGKHCTYFQRKVVLGHTHKGGTYFESRFGGKMIWELNAGYCADSSSIALGYMPTKHSRSTLGFGLITNGFPQFVPFEEK